MGTVKRWLAVARGPVGGMALMLAAGVLLVPEALAFPYKRQVGDTTVHAERPIPDSIVNVLVRSDRLLRRSAIFGPGYGRRIFLTDGGWRWRVLSLRASGAFALTRPLSEPVIVNRSDVDADRVVNGRAVGGVRPLSAVIAHERAHGLIRARVGLVRERLLPTWVVEGYCDHVSGGSSLSDADAARLEREGRDHPALVYHRGRKRVEAMLRANGGSVDRLFADAR